MHSALNHGKKGTRTGRMVDPEGWECKPCAGTGDGRNPRKQAVFSRKSNGRDEKVGPAAMPAPIEWIFETESRYGCCGKKAGDARRPRADPVISGPNGSQDGVVATVSDAFVVSQRLRGVNTVETG